MEAQNLALRGALQLRDCYELQDPLLDVLHTVVVLVQDDLSVF